MEADRPTSMPFATAIASSKFSTSMMPTTGPNTSSHAMRIFGETFVRTVGCMKCPCVKSPSVKRCPP